MNRSKPERNNEENVSSLVYTIKDAFGIRPRIEISGNTSATIDGCKGILEYSKTQIRVSLGNLSLQIKGRGLDLRSVSVSSLVIEGFITSVEYLM